MRKCRNKPCRKPLPKKKDCPNPIQAGGFCNMDCLMDHTREAQKQAQERKERKRKAETRAEKIKRNEGDKSHQEGLTQTACNALIRLIDHGKPCISCGDYAELEAGHFRSVGSCPEMRFHPVNIYGQCRPCNQAGSRKRNRGKNPETVAAMYEERLRQRMGDDIVDWVLGPHPMPKFTVGDLRAIRLALRAEARRLEAGGKVSVKWRRPVDVARLFEQITDPG